MSVQHELLSHYGSDLMNSNPPDQASSIPRIELEATEHSRLVFLTDPGGLATERYKILRRQLCGLKSDGGIVLVTSPAPADGKTLTSINLAFSLAEGGQSTCLVDLDFRAPGVFAALQHRSDAPDMLDVLRGRATTSEAMRQVGNRPLYLIGIREGAQAGTFHLDRESLASVLLRLRAAFSWVILDLAPAIPFSDISEVLPNVDGVVLVARRGKTKKSLIKPTLEVVGNKLWGFVLNDAEVSGGDYYGHYYYGRQKLDKNGEYKNPRSRNR
jgi:Mrp family chromosome partitioning ATPase